MNFNGIQLGLDIIGVLGFILSVAMIIKNALDNRVNIKIYDMWAYALPEYEGKIQFMLCGIFANHSARPISIHGIRIYFGSKWLLADRYERIVMCFEYDDPRLKGVGHEEFLNTPFPVNIAPWESIDIRIVCQTSASKKQNAALHPWAYTPLEQEPDNNQSQEIQKSVALSLQVQTSRKAVQIPVLAEIHAYGKLREDLQIKSYMRANVS